MMLRFLTHTHGTELKIKKKPIEVALIEFKPFYLLNVGRNAEASLYLSFSGISLQGDSDEEHTILFLCGEHMIHH